MIIIQNSGKQFVVPVGVPLSGSSAALIVVTQAEIDHYESEGKDWDAYFKRTLITRPSQGGKIFILKDNNDLELISQHTNPDWPGSPKISYHAPTNSINTTKTEEVKTWLGEEEMAKKEEQVEKYVTLLKVEVKNTDTETAHLNADELLCALLIELGFKDVVDAYTEVGKWYS